VHYHPEKNSGQALLRPLVRRTTVLNSSLQPLLHALFNKRVAGAGLQEPFVLSGRSIIRTLFRVKQVPRAPITRCAVSTLIMFFESPW
jgi:hypothetical protein